MALTQGNLVGLYNGPRAEMEPHWHLCRTLVGGTPSMRKAAGTYTPPTARERKDTPLYQERLASSVLLDAYEAAVKRIASAPFEKPPNVTGDLPWQFERVKRNADRAGTSLSVFGSMIYQDAVDRGMGMFLVDNVPSAYVDRDEKTGKETTRVLNRKEMEEKDVRPYFVRIDPDNYLGCKSEIRNGREVCTELRVREWAYLLDPKTQRDVLVERVRLFTGDTVEVWQRNYGTTTGVDVVEMAGKGDASGYALIEGPTPTMFPDGEIPLVVVYTNKRGFLHARPPMLALAWMNVEHWNLTSLHKNALRYCLNPTRFIKGASVADTEKPPKAGEGASFITTSDTAQMSFVEITGTSLQASERLIDKNEARMRVASVEHLQKGSATATGEVRAEMKDQSEAQKWVEGMEWALYYAFGLVAKWVRDTEINGYELPEDFNITLHRASSVMMVANPQRLPTLQADVRDGRLTNLTYLKELARSGYLSDDFDPAAEAEELAAAKSEQAQFSDIIGRIEDERAAKEAVPEKPEEKPEDDKATAEADADGGEPVVTFNELTLGMERLVRAGNMEGANALLKEAAALIDVASLGKVSKVKAPVPA